MKWTRNTLEHVALVAWGEIMRYSQRDCCVLATRVLVDTLAALGERDAYGLVVTALLLGPDGGHAEAHGCGLDIVTCPDRPESFGAVMLGHQPEVTHREGAHELWSGHLVAVVQRRWIVDMSISQATQHPEIGLVLDDPLVMDTNEVFLRGRGSATLDMGDGVKFIYEAHPGNDRVGARWKESPDWSWDQLRLPLTKGTLDRLSGKEPRYPEYMEAVRALVGRV